MRSAVSKVPTKVWWLAALVVLLGGVFLAGRMVTQATHDFPDVATGAWYHDDVTWIKDRGITLGCGGSNYCPNDNVTRAEMSAFLHRMGTGGSPRAFAFIQSDGTKQSGTANVSSTWNAGSSRYEITISGESYVLWDYTTVVTPSSSPCDQVFTSMNSGGGKLFVIFKDTGGSNVQCQFQFATFEP